MFFILSINTKKNTVSIVGHAATLDDAIAGVQDYARNYVVAKNAPVLHRGADESNVKFTERVHFYTKDCANHVHQIDVFRQQTHKVKGWTGSSYKEDSQLVRRFSYDEYAIPDNNDNNDNNEKKKQVIQHRPKIAKPQHSNSIGGFPNNIINSLRESDAFKKHRATSDRNILPPQYKHTVFIDAIDNSSSDDDS